MRSLIYLVVIIVQVLVASYSRAVENQVYFDWYYAAVFGTGSYRVGDRDVFVLKLPYETQVRAATNDKYAIMLTASLTLSFYDYKLDDLADLELPSDVATATIFPGLYYVIPLNEHWTLKPFANLGYGKEFSGGEEALIYSAGARVNYQRLQNDWNVQFGSSLYYAGNTRETETALGFVTIDAAADITHATPWSIKGQKLYMGGYVGTYHYSNLEFIQTDDSAIEISNQYEIGVSMNTRKRIEVAGLSLQRVALGYLFSNGFTAWRLTFSLPY